MAAGPKPVSHPAVHHLADRRHGAKRRAVAFAWWLIARRSVHPRIEARGRARVESTRAGDYDCSMCNYYGRYRPSADHNRMPVLFTEPRWGEAWLDPRTDTAELAKMLAPAGDDLLETFPVTQRRMHRRWRR